ncbi:MAG: hypothetical protein R3F20_03170 [Planctomycetota bacterium]
MRRSIDIALLVVGVLAAALPILYGLNSVSPMQKAFRCRVTVENALDGPIEVTPLGQWDASSRRRGLPILADGPFAVSESRRGAMPIGPGDSIEFTYDWDDVYFVDLVVRDIESDVLGVIVVDEPTDFSRFRALSPPKVRVVPLAIKWELTPEQSSACEEASRPSTFNGWVVILAVVSLASFIALGGRILRRRRRVAAAPMVTPV